MIGRETEHGFWFREDRSLAPARMAVGRGGVIVWRTQEYRLLMRGSNDQGVTPHRVGIRQCTGWQFDSRVGAECNGDPPRLHGMPDSDDASVTAHERDIDRESHKKCMNRAGRRDNQRMTL